MSVHPSGYNSDNNYESDIIDKTKSNIYSSDIRVIKNKCSSRKTFEAEPFVSHPSNSQKKTACRIVEKETSPRHHLLEEVYDYANINAGSNRSRSQCIDYTEKTSEVYPENNPRRSSRIERAQIQQDWPNVVVDTGAEELLHQLNRGNSELEQHNKRINSTIDNNNNKNRNNFHQDRNTRNPAASSGCDIPRFILVPHTTDSSTCANTDTNTNTTQATSQWNPVIPNTEPVLNHKTTITASASHEIELEFNSSPKRGSCTYLTAPALPPAGPPSLKKSFSLNTGTTETNTFSSPAELRYSGSFNSKSTHLSYRCQDYSEEKRLLLLAASYDSSSNSNLGINHNSIRTSSSTRNNISHRRTKSHPLSNNLISKPSIGLRRSSSHNTNISNNTTDPTKKKYTHRHSSSPIESPHRSCIPSTVPMTLTPHSNLADLINASKKIQQSQAAAAAAAGEGPGSGMGGRNRRGASSGNSNDIVNNGGNNSNMGSKASSPKARPALTRPNSISSKSKSTGMYFSPKEKNQYANTAGNNNDVSFSSSAAKLYSASSSVTQSKAHVSRHSYSYTPQSQTQHTHNRSLSHSVHGKQGVKLLPQMTRPGIVKQSSTTGTIGNLALNPFEDPSLIGDMHRSNNPTHGGDFINYMNNATVVASAHPLQSNIMSNNSNGGGNVVEFDPLKITSSASSTSSTQQYPQQQQQQQQHHHQPSPSIDTAQLSELAAALSSLKPQQLQKPECSNDVNMNLEQLKVSDHQVTLGHKPKESTGTSKSHRRFLSLRGPKSMNVDEMKGVMDFMQQQQSGSESFDYGGVTVTGSGSSDQYDIISNGSKDKKDKKHKRAASLGIFKRNDNTIGGERPITPVKGLKRGKNNTSPSSSNGEEEEGIGRSSKSPGRRKRSIRLGGGKNQSKNANYDNNNGVTPSHSPRRMSGQPLETIQSNESAGSGSYLVAQCSSAGSPTSQIKLRSSEQDPSPHQIIIPSISDVLLQVKLCHLMERYREIDQNFHFGALSNVSREDMEMFVGLDKKSRPNSPIRQSASGGSNFSPPKESTFMQNAALTSPSPVSTSRLSNLVDVHKPIVKSIVSAASDLVLAAFFYATNQKENTITHDTTQDKSPGDRTEVAIFASDDLRQFIVVYQGSAENQTKPIRKRFTGKFKSNVAKNFRSDEEHLTVFPPFEQGYSQSGLQDKVFKKLDALAEQHPFFDVIVTGHSYGGMMALLGSMRYACSRPAMMVSCFAFGCPKVGALDFRHYANSLPNLKVTRFEYGFDPWVHAPDNPTWTHAGHTVSILQQVQSSKERKGGNDKGNKDNTQNNKDLSSKSLQIELLIRAYKFGNDRPDSAANGKFIGKKGNRQEKQIDHDIASYLNAIELVAKEGVSWPRQFVGEEGTGVRGLNKETRRVC